VTDDDTEDECDGVHDGEEPQAPHGEEVKEDGVPVDRQADLHDFSPEESPERDLDDEDQEAPAEQGSEDTHANDHSSTPAVRQRHFACGSPGGEA